REAEGMLLVHGRDIIEPVKVRQRLQVGLIFDELFGTAVQEANMGICTLHHLAVEFQKEAQNTVRRRVLRSKIDGEAAVLKSGFRLQPAPMLWPHSTSP